MAGLKKQNIERVPASSLLEVMVALVLMFVVFAIATGLYANVMKSSFNLQQTTAMAELEKLAADTKRNQTLIDENTTVGNFTIEKTIKVSTFQNGLLLLHLVAKNTEGKIVADRKEIILPEK